MANYSIVLNLRGNAIRDSKRLADNLERADRAATRLKKNLSTVRVPSGGGRSWGYMNGGRNGGYTGNFNSRHSSQIGGVNVTSTFSSQSGLGSVIRFTGKLNAALAIVDAVVRAAAFATKLIAKAHIVSYGGGVFLLKGAADLLTSAPMAEGIRLLQRRKQAQAGFGSEYEQAQERSERLAASYGFNPSTVIANMNVMKGMRVGDKRINLAQAERLTQVGGMIAQQSGLAFETVMVNIQQMLAQAVPSMRDIRQLLTHAPILSRYALDEMEKRGVTNMTALEFLQNDKGALMQVFERFLRENPSLPSMQARGMVQMANTELFSKLAENPVWLSVADSYVRVLEPLTNALTRFFTAVETSSAVHQSIERFVVLVESIPVERIVKFFDTLGNMLHQTFGLGLTPSEEVETAQAAHARVARRSAMSAALTDKNSSFENDILRVYHEKGWSVPESTEGLVADIQHKLRNEEGRSITGVSYTPLNYKPELVTPDVTADLWFQKPVMAAALVVSRWLDDRKTEKDVEAMYAEAMTKTGLPSYVLSRPFHDVGAAFATVGLADIVTALQKLPKASTANLAELAGGGVNGVQGEAISGYGADRKSLVINFNAPIVEWDSTINTDDPDDVVSAVSETIEGAATRAIQIALLGATGTMSSRF